MDEASAVDRLAALVYRPVQGEDYRWSRSRDLFGLSLHEKQLGNCILCNILCSDVDTFRLTICQLTEHNRQYGGRAISNQWNNQLIASHGSNWNNKLQDNIEIKSSDQAKQRTKGT